LEEQMDKSDLLAAAASTVASLTKYSNAEGSDIITQDEAQSQGTHSEIPTAPASALLLGITALSEEDNYD
uniref:E3 ubiquitin-protein ligase UBR4 n=2 Tax=Schistocephalus solidus TaxID=70667 RepID=A0A183SC13_SCHSO